MVPIGASSKTLRCDRDAMRIFLEAAAMNLGQAELAVTPMVRATRTPTPSRPGANRWHDRASHLPFRVVAPSIFRFASRHRGCESRDRNIKLASGWERRAPSYQPQREEAATVTMRLAGLRTLVDVASPGLAKWRS
jgi:hypothetical protein